ncbi:serine/threonine protein kinase [Modestobacter sp. SYSU DS0290]
MSGTNSGAAAPGTDVAEPRPVQEPAGADSPSPARHRARPGGERIALWLGALIAVVTPAVAAADLAFPGRTLLAVAFVLTVPGVPLAVLLRVPDRLLRGSLAGALSVAVTLLTATLQVVTGWWSPVGFAAGTAAVSLAATVVALRRTPRAAPRTAGTGRPSGAHVGGRSTDRERPVAVVALLAALGLWWTATRWLELDDAGALGVIGVVGWAYVAALVLVALVAARQLLRPVLDGPVLAATAVVLAVVLFAFTNVGDGRAGVSVGWLHVGFIRFITEQQATFAGLDARAYWPGFFGSGAHLVELAGLPDASAFLTLSPAVFNIAAIAPLLVVARCVTRSRRLAWLAVFLYLTANWFQQDYYAPQAVAYLLYLVVLAVLLWSVTSGGTTPLTGRWYRRALTAWRRRPGLPDGVTAGQALAWEGALLLIAAAVVVSHQLTPATLVFALMVFVVTGSTRYRRLWLLVSLLFLGWFSYQATDFWVGHLSTVLGDLGRLNSNLTSAVSARVGLDSDPVYDAMQNMRLGWSVLYALTALLGWWTIRHRPGAPLLAGLTVCAGGLVLFGSYGGEVVLRSFVFAAPLLASLAALALRGLTRHRGPVAVGVLALFLTAAALALTATRGVNIAFERVTSGDLAAARVIAERLQEGQVVGTLQATGALGADRVGESVPLDMSEAGCGMTPLRCALVERPDFIVVSRTQDALGQLREGRPAGWTTEIADELVDRGAYTVVHEGGGATVLAATPEGG